MPNLNWSDPIKICLILLRCVGLWPKKKDNRGKINIYAIYSALILGTFVFLDVVSELISLYFIFDNLKIFVYQISVFPFRAIAVVKSCFFIYKIKSIKKIAKEIRNDIFQPSGSTEENIFKKNIKQWKFLCAAIWSFVSGTVIYVLSPLLDKEMKGSLLYAAWYPYNIKETPQYEITLSYQTLSLFVHACINTSSDLYFSALNLFIGCQYEFLCHQLKILNFQNKNAIIRCIEHHKRIIELITTPLLFYELNIIFLALQKETKGFGILSRFIKLLQAV